MSNTFAEAIDQFFEIPATAADKVFDIPLKTVDQIFDIPPEIAQPENTPHKTYERYRNGLHNMEAGAVLAIGGLAAGAAGLEAGGFVSAGGWLVAWYGTAKALWNVGKLDTN